MNNIKIFNITKGLEIATSSLVADSFFLRLKGLLGTKTFPKGGALIIKPCFSVHTIGMAYAIDVLFVNEQNTIIKVVESLQPGRLASCRGSAYVVELPAGTADTTGTTCGHLLSFILE